MRNLIDHEWRQFDSESCPEAFCGGYDEHRDESWKTSWDGECRSHRGLRGHKLTRCVC